MTWISAPASCSATPSCPCGVPAIFSIIATRMKPRGDGNGFNRPKVPIESSFTTRKIYFQEPQ
ncbi:hypothetical protein AGR1_12245 [Agrobacterium sp. B1(2019)]|nr:hypothetical protein AGR1_12245 [Agrobacterium sp. B1(2019)]